MRHTISLFVLLSSIWLLNSGHFGLLLLLFGLASVCLVVWIARRMDVVDRESQPLHLTRRIPSYYLWLLKQLVLSNIDVVKRIWLGNGSISPSMATLPLNQRTDLGRVVYANSVTLTPGTVAIDVEGNQMLVHSLTREGIADLQSGDMDQRVCRLDV